MADSPTRHLERAIAGALRATIKDHGPVTPEDIGSATKRVLGQLRNAAPGPDPGPPERCRPVLRAAYLCPCTRCGHVWLSPCGCPPIAAPDEAGLVVIALPAHRTGCQPPKACARCKSTLWQVERGVRPKGRRPKDGGEKA